MADCGHADGEAPACGRDGCTAGEGHRLGESPGHDTSCCRPGTRSKPNGMNLNLDIGRVNEHSLEIFDVLLNSLCLVAVGPCHGNILRVTFTKPVPLLIRKDVEIQRVECL